MQRYEFTDSEVETIANGLQCYADECKRLAADEGLHPRLIGALKEAREEALRLAAKLADEPARSR